MRLIDADELRWTDLQDGFGRINTCIVFESDINALPTVDAIPIEFIEKYAQLSDTEDSIEREKGDHYFGIEVTKTITL